MSLLVEVQEFCRQVARYTGPQQSKAVETISKFEYESETAAYNRAFELGYKRGYADCADYIADWCDEDEETD